MGEVVVMAEVVVVMAEVVVVMGEVVMVMGEGGGGDGRGWWR